MQNIAALVLTDVWGELLAAGPEQVRDAIRALFAKIAERVEFNADASDFYDSLDPFEQHDFADQLISNGILDQLSELRATGRYLSYCGPGVLAKFFAKKPVGWFGTVWSEKLPDPAEVGAGAAESAREQLVGVYARCLDDCAGF